MRLDNRLLLILLLAFVYLYGWTILHWDFDFSKLVAIFSFGLLTQTLFCLAFKIPVNAAISTIITTMLLGLMIRTEFIFICGMVSFFAVSSKYIFQYNGKHLFNPANFGLIFMILFTHQAFITTHQTDFIVISGIVLGIIGILYRSDAKKIDMLVFYFALNLLVGFVYKFLGYSFESFQLNDVWFLIYSFILVADPLSSPNSRIGRLIWALAIVLITHVLGCNLNLPYAHFYALAIGGFVMVLIDYVFNKEARFSWDSVHRRALYTNDLMLT
ncbi:MAG: hypothetical protein ACK5UE_12300 [Chitinophagales bacterium]|jgi:Na+-transporting NADH:ubiquinone oxidoreductase subunit NqrB|nr:hypothetical protein [Sphingobacteriales bacterium]